MSDSVAKRTDIVEAMVAATARQRALMGGTMAMREAGETYLPKFASEEREDYTARKNASWLFNGYRKTVKDMSGKVFAKPVELAEGAPDDLLTWADNVDNAGRDLSSFARDVFEDGYDAGISFIMVDAPPRQGTVTRAQARAANLRPYLVHVPVECVLGWKSEPINNVQTLTQLRIMESVTLPDPDDEFAEVTIEQVRVLDLMPTGVQTRLFRKAKVGNRDTWQLFEEPTMSGMTEITVVPFYANRSGFWQGKPLLDDLADVNIAHWQSQSDQRNILHFARVPILFVSGRSQDEGKMTIAAGVATASENPDAKLAWVEHGGQAIGSGRQDLKDLEFQMETHGLQLLVARQGAQSATGEALDAAKETSTLAMTADALQDALEQAMRWAADYAGLGGDNSVSVTVNKDYGVNMMGAQEFAAMLSAVNTGNLSRETFLRELKRRGMVASDMNVEDELERVEMEGPDLADMAPDDMNGA